MPLVINWKYKSIIYKSNQNMTKKEENIMKLEEKIKSLNKFLGQDTIQFVKQHYRREYADIMSGKMTDSTKAILETCKHNADFRSPIVYAQEVISGWTVENFIENVLDKNDYVSIKLIGVDKNREFVKGKKVSSNPDFLIEIVNADYSIESFYIEVVTDYYNYWKKNEVGHLRDNKLIKLIELSKFENVFILAVDIVNEKIAFIQVTEDMDKEYIQSHKAYGGKSAYQIPILRSKFFNISDIEVQVSNFLIA